MAKIMIVSMSERGASLIDLLERAGHEVIAAGSVPDATAFLATDRSVEILIPEIQLGAYNGLQLVIRHQLSHPLMRAIVLSRSHDPVLAAYSNTLGAAYLAEPFENEQLLQMVLATLLEINPQRRWPRKQPAATLLARVEEKPARVLDLSYGGLRLETSDPRDLPARFEIVFRDAGITIQAKPIWSQPGPAGSRLYGADVSDLGYAARQQWQRLVDSVPASA